MKSEKHPMNVPRVISKRRLLIALPVVLIGLAALAVCPPHPARKAAAATQPQPTPGIPKLISIPKLHIQANLDQVGLAQDRTMASPTSPTNPAWFKLGPRPGAKGNAVLAGHLDGQNFAPAVFYHLKDLSPGDLIIITDDHDHPWPFRVARTQSYDARRAPLAQIFGNAATPQLNLITCAGSWDRSRQEYNDRLVVFADAH
jgi:sortase A